MELEEERRQAKQALRQSEERFRALIENSMDVIAVVGSDGTISYESPSVEQVLGYKPEELIGKNMLEFIHPDDVQPFSKTHAMTIENPGQLIPMELRLLHRDGSWRVLEGTGNNLIDDPRINGIVANYRDITERKQAEEALRESEERFRQIFDGVNDEIVYTDTDGVVLNVNEKSWDISGYRPDEMIGRNVLEFDLFDSDELSKLSELMMASVEQGSARRPLLEVQARHRDGHVVPLEVSTSLMTAADGAPKGFVSIIRDITERRQSKTMPLKKLLPLWRYLIFRAI